MEKEARFTCRRQIGQKTGERRDGYHGNPLKKESSSLSSFWLFVVGGSLSYMQPLEPQKVPLGLPAECGEHRGERRRQERWRYQRRPRTSQQSRNLPSEFWKQDERCRSHV